MESASAHNLAVKFGHGFDLRERTGFPESPELTSDHAQQFSDCPLVASSWFDGLCSIHAV